MACEAVHDRLADCWPFLCRRSGVGRDCVHQAITGGADRIHGGGPAALQTDTDQTLPGSLPGQSLPILPAQQPDSNAFKVQK